MQKEVADQVGIKRGTYAHYEIDKRLPEVETLVALADFFEVSTDWLLCRTDERHVAKSFPRLHISPTAIDPEVEREVQNYREYLVRKNAKKPSVAQRE